MSIQAQTRYDARAAIARALAHPTRLMLLDALHRKELCVGEMTRIAGADQSTVSRHLAILKQAGLVGVRKEGSMSVFSLRCQCLDGFFRCIEAVLEQNLKAQQEVLSQARTRNR